MRGRKDIVWLVVLCLVSVVISAQDRVYLEHSETLSFDQQRIPDAEILRGNVCFRHDQALMYCDSAYFYEKSNSLDAFGHIRFVQGDTLFGYGDMLFYDGNTRCARLRRHVRLVHNATTLTTDTLLYDRNAERAWYSTGGTIEDTVSTLTSRYGCYYTSTSHADFRYDVHLVNNQFTLDADTLHYNTKTHVADLVAPTTIVYQEETTILSSNGWYNTETEQSLLLDRSQILHIDGKQMTADTIYYDKHVGYARMLHAMELKDTVQQSSLLGHYGEYHEEGERGYATDSAMLVDWSNDTAYTYIHADTLFTELVDVLGDSVRSDTAYRRVRAHHGVRVFNREYQMVCDSLVYNDLDSVATLYHLPICWSDYQQVSADTVWVYLRNETVDYLHGIGSAIAIKQENHRRFDQMAGKEMYAYVRDGEVYQIAVNGNAETIFFPREEDGAFVGCNKTQSSFVNMYLKDQQVDHVVFTTSTKGTIYPLDQIADADTYLQQYFWADTERPKQMEDIFLRPEHTFRPKSQAVSAAVEEEEPTLVETSDAEGEEVTPVQEPKTQRNKRKKSTR